MSLYRASTSALVPTVFLAMTLACGDSRAADGPSELMPGQWSASIGVGSVLGPKYPGSDETSVSPVPLIDLRYRVGLAGLDTVFLQSSDGLGAVVLRQGAFSAGFSVGYASGRDEDDGDRLRGLGDIDGAARGRLFLRADFGALGLSLEAERAFGAQDGSTLTAEASYSAHLTPALTIIGRFGVTLADADSQRQWFGVSDDQSRRSGLAPFRPDGGLRSGALEAAAVYALTPHWRVSARAGVLRLLGDAADSPVVESETQPFGFLGVSYRF